MKAKASFVKVFAGRRIFLAQAVSAIWMRVKGLTEIQRIGARFVDSMRVRLR
jgi:hypothetical protein